MIIFKNISLRVYLGRSLVICIFLLWSNKAYPISEAENYLKEMLEIYGKMAVYEDYGYSIITVTKVDESKTIDRLEFRTVFRRGDIKYEWQREQNDNEKKMILPPGYDASDLLKPKKYIIWKDAVGIYSKYRSEPVVSHVDLLSAFSGAAGISEGLSWKVPRFLTSGVSCFSDFDNSTFDIVDNNAYISVRLKFNAKDEDIYYINKKDKFLEKHEKTRWGYSGEKIHQITIYNVLKARS